MNPLTRVATLGTLLLFGGCAGLTEKEPLRITPKSEIATSPVVREVVPQSAQPVQPAPPVPPAAAANPESAAPSLASVAPPAAIAPPPGPPAIAPKMPAGTLYVCNGMVHGQPQQTAIEYEPRVHKLCAKHPEMGVCQYEREACRKSGGQVFDAAGREITPQVEAEYDRKVMRIRFRAG
ncbi:MAG: hypothetical protein ABI831_14790 [Betaproteobacteria bacterium]